MNTEATITLLERIDDLKEKLLAEQKAHWDDSQHSSKIVADLTLELETERAKSAELETDVSRYKFCAELADAQRQDARTENGRLTKILKEFEWVVIGGPEAECLVCSNSQRIGHEEGCVFEDIF